MTTLKFNDGQEFNTSGELRIEERFDGLYVVGKGMLIPVKDRKEAEQTIQAIEKSLKRNDRSPD